MTWCETLVAVIQGDGGRDCCSLRSCKHISVKFSLIENIHPYLYKKGDKEVHKAIQGDAENPRKAVVSTGSPGPKDKSCISKTYVSYLGKAAKGPLDQP